jgi:hypothetical protein
MTDYGSDLMCVTDLDPAMAEHSGRMVLAHALARRLSTPRGGLVDDPNYGYDVVSFINDDVDTHALALLGSSVDREFEKDERVVSSETEVSFVGGVLTISSTVTDGDGPFQLVTAVGNLASENGVVILKVSQ